MGVPITGLERESTVGRISSVAGAAVGESAGSFSGAGVELGRRVADGLTVRVGSAVLVRERSVAAALPAGVAL